MAVRLNLFSNTEQDTKKVSTVEELPQYMLKCIYDNNVAEESEEAKQEKMAKIKTEVKLQLDESDSTIADLMTTGCNMGIKSLGKNLNQYTAADEKSKDITKRLICLEEQLVKDIRKFL